MTKRYQLIGIGNAMVDVLCHVEDRFLDVMKVEKGIMQLIDTDRAAELYRSMGPSTEISGGSAANTIAGFAALGGRTAYVGKVKDDQLGSIFSHDIRAQGADFETPLAPVNHQAETGRCMVLVTPDGERSMNTYLGVSEFLSPDDIDTDQMADTDWLYLEGYRFDGPESKAAFAKAIDACRAAGGRVSVTLSDPFCVERHRDDFMAMIRDHIDLLFCNKHEVMSLYQTDDFEEARHMAAKDTDILACTASEDGAYIRANGGEHHIPTKPVTPVDATGAGDLFAAGFLHGLIQGADPDICGKMGNIAASEVISHIGARPEADLKELFQQDGLS